MTDLKKAAQEFVTDYENGDLGDLKHYARAFRAALEQPEQAEPVAINCQAKRDNGGVCPHHNLQCGWPNCNKPQRIKLEQRERPNECHWYQDGDEDSGTYMASCSRRYFVLDDGTPTDNRMTHCCYCGKPLVEVLIEPEDNHD
jgi:hypothetical protein